MYDLIVDSYSFKISHLGGILGKNVFVLGNLQFYQLSQTLPKILPDSITKLLCQNYLDGTENLVNVSKETLMPREMFKKKS